MLNILWCLYTLLVTRQLNTIFKQIPSNYYIRLEIRSSIFFLSHSTAKIERHLQQHETHWLCIFFPLAIRIRNKNHEDGKRQTIVFWRTHTFSSHYAYRSMKSSEADENSWRKTKIYKMICNSSTQNIKCARFRICTITPYTWLSCECSTHLHP